MRKGDASHGMQCHVAGPGSELVYVQCDQFARKARKDSLDCSMGRLHPCRLWAFPARAGAWLGGRDA